MDIFLKASKVRLISHKDRFLVADDDGINISHGSDESTPNTIWSVEIVDGKDAVRLKSCYGTYLTASPTTIISGVTGKKVVQTWPFECDAAADWEPSRDGMEVRLRSVYGQYLRPNGGLPPWRNVITHDVYNRGKTLEKSLWDVEVVEKCSDHRQPPAFVRSRSLPEFMEEGFYDMKWWWFPKPCMPF